MKQVVRPIQLTLMSLLTLSLIACPSGGGGSSDSGSGSQESSVLSSDFEPPTGKVEGPGPYGPWNYRLMTATSSDGLTWTRTNLVVTDQGDVPDLVVDKSGRIHLYYICWTVDNESNRLVVALSDDKGDTWVYKKVKLTGFETMSDAVDPDIRILDDGSFRIYLTADPHDGDGPRSHYADSDDGINFEYKGVAFYIPGEQVVDPSGFKLGSTWHLFAGGSVTTDKGNWHGTSTDGALHTYVEDNVLSKDGLRFAFSNAIRIEGGIRVYGFPRTNEAVDPPKIASFTSTDGFTWTADDGWRLEMDSSGGLESEFVKDCAVVELADGTFLMVYATVVP